MTIKLEELYRDYMTIKLMTENSTKQKMSQALSAFESKKLFSILSLFLNEK
jgi:hypothetical protein